MSWRKIAFWLLLVFLGSVAIAVTWVWTADLGVFKPRIERMVSDAIGRPFSIGELSIDVAGRIQIVAHDLRVANADGFEPDDMMGVERIEATVVLASLFDPPLILESIVVEGARIHLDAPADRAPNWVLDRPQPPRDSAREADGPALPVLLRDVRVSGLRLVHRSAARPEAVELVLASMRQRFREDEFLDTEFVGTVNDRAISLSGEVGPWSSLRAARAIDYRFSGRFDTLTLSAAGHIDDLAAPSQPTIELELMGPEIDDLTRMLGLGEDGSGDIALEAALLRNENAGLDLTVAGHLGQTTIDARGRFESLQDLRSIDAEVRSAGPSLGRTLALVGVHGIDPAPFDLRFEVQRDGSELIIPSAGLRFGDARVELTADLPRFPALDDGRAALQLNGDDLARLQRWTGLPDTVGGPYSATAELHVDPDRGERFDVDLATSLGRLNAEGTVRGGASFEGTTASFEVDVPDIRQALHGMRSTSKSLPDQALSARGAIEVVEGALRTTQPLSVALPGLDVDAEGQLALAPRGVGSRLQLRARGPGLARLASPWSESPYIPPDPFDLSMQMHVEPDGLRLQDLAGAVGATSIDGDAVLRLGPDLVGSSLGFSISGDALEASLAHVPALAIRPGPFALDGAIRLEDGALVLEGLEATRAAGTLRADARLALPIDRREFMIEVGGGGEDADVLFVAFPAFDPAEAPFTLQGAIQRTGGTLRVDRFEATLGDARLAANGTLDFSERVDRNRFQVSVDVPSLARLGEWKGRSFHDQAFGFEGVIDGAAGQLQIEEARWTLAESDLTGKVSYAFGEPPRLDVDLAAQRVSMQPIFEPPDAPVEAVVADLPDGRLIPDIELPFDALDRLDAAVRIRIGTLERNRLLLRDLGLDATLRSGVLQVEDLSFHGRSGSVRAQATIEGAAGAGRAEFALVADDLALGLSETNPDLGMTSDLWIAVEASGNRLRDMAADADGLLFVNTSGGRLPSNRMVEFLYGDVIDQVVSTINPFARSDPYTTFECIVIPLEITAGEVTSVPASYIRTDKLNLTFRSEIDLATERLDINVRSTPRRLLSISAAELVNPYVKVIGTLGAPALAVDQQGVLISGGAAVATGGLSLLARAAWDRLSKSSDPCRSAYEQGHGALADRLPDIAPLEPLPPLPVTPARPAD